MPVKVKTESVLMSTQEAAEQLGVGRSAISEAIRKGQIKAQKLGSSLGGVWMVTVAEVERYRKERRPVGRPRKTA